MRLMKHELFQGTGLSVVSKIQRCLKYNLHPQGISSLEIGDINHPELTNNTIIIIIKDCNRDHKAVDD